MNYWIRRLVELASRFSHSSKQARNILFYPKVETQKDLDDLVKRIEWHFPNTREDGPTIFVFARKGLKLPPFKYKGVIVSLSKKEKFYKHYIDDADAIAIWDMSKVLQMPNLLGNFRKIWIVDKNYLLITEARNYVQLYNATIPEKELEYLLAESSARFSNMLIRCSPCVEALVFGTGPSATKALDINMPRSHAFKIVTNTLINDKELVDYIEPNGVVFGDYVYHVGSSKYAARFREQMVKFIKDGFEIWGYGRYGFVRFETLPLLLAHYPELKDWLIGIPFELFKPWNILGDVDKFYVRQSNNSLSVFLLPIASAIVDKVYILGCDGRAPSDKLFWGHAKTTHYDDLLEDLKRHHPSVYRDTEFQDFYEQNAKDIKDFIEFGESKGKQYYCLAPSNIPALKERQVNDH